MPDPETIELPAEIIELLEQKYLQYNQPEFIPSDPVSIPHRFSNGRDIEIAGFFAAILAWGRRQTIIDKTLDLLGRMDHAPFDFIRNHQTNDLHQLESFCHRTFNSTDLLYFISFLQRHYQRFESLEQAFLPVGYKKHPTVEQNLVHFYNYFSDSEFFPERTRKHIATPQRGSACKRLNMFLRWMVRKDDRGVDFGLWSEIKPAQLVCPFDVHVERVAGRLGLASGGNNRWRSAIGLTETLKLLDPTDPVKYDFALFGLGIEGSY